MRTTFGLAATVLALAAAGAARAEEKQSDPKAIIQKGIEARGGAEKLAKLNAITFKATGKFYGMGDGNDFSGDWSVQQPDKFHMNLSFDLNGMKFNLTIVFNGKEGWTKVNDMLIDMDEATIAEMKENLYADRVESLVTLVKDKGYKLSPAGDSKVGDVPVVGVRVAHDGFRDITLFFDKKSGQLLRSERVVKDQQQGGKERTQVSTYSDYKDIDGAKVAMKVVVTRDGDKYVESEMTDFKTHDKLEDSLFAKP